MRAGGAGWVLAASRQAIDRIHDIVDRALRTRWTVRPIDRPDREKLEGTHLACPDRLAGPIAYAEGCRRQSDRLSLDVTVPVGTRKPYIYVMTPRGHRGGASCLER